VDARPVVGERRALVSGIGGAHRDDVRYPPGRHRTGITAFVARGHRIGDARSHRALDGLVEGRVDVASITPAEAHVGHRRLDCVLIPPVDAGDDRGRGAVPGAVQPPYRHDPHGAGHAVVGAAEGTGDVRAVAVAVGRVAIAVYGVHTADRATAEG